MFYFDMGGICDGEKFRRPPKSLEEVGSMEELKDVFLSGGEEVKAVEEEKKTEKVSKKQQREQERRQKLNEAIINVDNINQHEAVYVLQLEVSAATWKRIKKMLNDELKAAAEKDEELQKLLSAKAEKQKQLVLINLKEKKTKKDEQKREQLKRELKQIEEEFKQRYPNFVKYMEEFTAKINILQSEKRRVIKNYVNESEIAEFVGKLDHELKQILS